MQRNWIVRKGAPSITLDEHSNTVQILAARRISISKSDVLVLLNGSVFTHIATVENVATVRSPSEGSDTRKVTDIVHSGWSQLEQPVEFELFTSSLALVTNHKRPKLHLRPGYRSLSMVDLETIRQGEPFLAREAYLSLLEALPESTQRAFLAEQLLTQGAEGPATYQERAASLIQFIEDRILSVGSMIISIDELWEGIRKRADVPSSVESVLALEDPDAPLDSIRKQADRFREVQHHIRAEPESRTAFELTREAMQSAEQSTRVKRFEEIFAKLAS